MPRPAHHAALAAVNGKIYAFGGFVAPATTAIPLGAAWEPIADAYEFNPATDSWKPLAPLPGKRGSAIAAEVGGKIYVIGGATTMDGDKAPFFTAFGAAKVLATNDVYDPATNKWESRNPMSVPRNHAFSGVVNGKIYVNRRPHRHGFILSGDQHRCGRSVRPGFQHVEHAGRSGCRPLAAAEHSGTDGRRIYVAGGEVTTTELFVRVSSRRSHTTRRRNSWMAMPSMPMPRHGVAGAVINNRFHTWVSGMIQSAGAMAFLDPTLATHPAMHDIFELHSFRIRRRDAEARVEGPLVSASEDLHNRQLL
jgi:hypothetical protein